MSSSTPLPGRSGRLFLVVIILLFGFVLRTTDIGAAPLQGDEAWLTFLAYNFGHNGQRAELGVTSSAGVNQPPFFHDVFAIPFAFDPDPRIARLFMAMLQLVGMAVLYCMARRYWGRKTGLAALIFYTVLPRAAWAGRFLWNPYLAVPFLVVYVATGLFLAEGKRWARWLHLSMLACAAGAHPIMAISAPLSLGFFARDWFRERRRRTLVLDHAIGVALALLVLAPWIYGYVNQRVENPQQGNFAQRGRTDFGTILQFTVQAPEWIDLGSFAIPRSDYVAPPDALWASYELIGWLTLLGSFYLVGRASLRMIRDKAVESNYPDLMLGLAYLVPPAVLLLSPTRTYEQYFMQLVAVAAVIQAVLLFGDGRRPSLRAVRPLKLGLGALMCIAELALVINVMVQIHAFNHVTRDSMPSLQEMIRIRDEAVRPGFETIYLVDSGSAHAFEQELVWLTLANKGPSRVLWGNNYALPVPVSGATYVGYADAQNIPELYALPAPRFIADNTYRVVDLPPNSGFTPTCQPDGISRLGNGVTILGYYVPPQANSNIVPQPGQPWTIYLLWKAAPNTLHTSFQLFTHLVDAGGDRYAQSDIATLVTDLWRDTDLLVSKVILTATDKLPVGQPLFLRTGMYLLPTVNHPNITGVNAVDDDGNPIAGWITIPICNPTGGIK